MKKSIRILVMGVGIVLFGCELGVAMEEGTQTEESKIEPQKVSIIGKDKSVLEDEEEEVIMKPLPKIEPPAYTMEKVAPPQIEPKPILPKVEEIKKPTANKKKTASPTLYSFGVVYGSNETLLYDFTHMNETKDVGYYFRIDRSKSAGFTWHDKSPFQKFSQDYISTDWITNFEKYSLRTKLEYLNKDLILPYQNGEIENKLKKSVGLSYEVKVQPESKLSLGIDFSKSDICGRQEVAKNDVIELHLGFYTPFKKGNPPLTIGTNIYTEKLEDKGINRRLKSYSLYLEGKRFKIHPLLLLDTKISLDEYKSDFSPSQLDFLLNLHYSKKENIALAASIERSLVLPTFDELYIQQDFRDINSKVEPEESWNYEISGDYRLSDDLFLEGDIFTQRIDKYIILTGGSPTFVYRPENIKRADFSGLKFGLRYYFNPKLSQNINYSYTNAKNKSDGKLPNVPKSRLEMGLRYKDGEKLTINLNTEYVDSTFAATSSTTPELDSYFLVNVSGEKRINENLFYSFSCENLLGEDYQYLAGYPGQERRFAIGVRLRF